MHDEGDDANMERVKNILDMCTPRRTRLSAAAAACLHMDLCARMRRCSTMNICAAVAARTKICVQPLPIIKKKKKVKKKKSSKL